MRTEIIPLGIASASPTRQRHLSGLVLRRQGQLLLFDCGEGTQYQLLRAGLSPSRLAAIFITHLHGDHFYGLPGLLSTMTLHDRTAPLHLVGPAGLKAFVTSLPGLGENDAPPFPQHFTELEKSFGHAVVFDRPDFFVEARPLEHRVFTAGYRFQEKPRPGRLDAERARALGVTDPRDFGRLKRGEAVTGANGHRIRPEEVVGPEQPGRAFAYVTDTAPCAGGIALARDADLLYHDATFDDAYVDRAEETGHATARQAAEVARRAGAGRLLLGHFSARYDDPAPLVAEARAVFKNTEAAEELKCYPLGV